MKITILILIMMFGLFKAKGQTYKTEQIVEGQVVEIDYTEFRDLRKTDKYEEFYVGSLNITSGQIIITDPLLLYTTIPLQRNVRPGNYPVCLYFKQTEFGYRTCYAIIQFQDSAPKKWEIALMDTSGLEETDKKINGLFPVDAGLLSFSDMQACKAYQEAYNNFAEKKKDGNFYDDKLASGFAKNGNNPKGTGTDGDWLNYKLESESGNMIMFSSGIGDGLYPAYWGLNQKGNPVQLVIDFMTVGRIEKFKESQKKKK